MRSNVREGTELGLEAEKFMDAGALVPDDLIISMMKKRMGEDDAARGFLLDGFPRTSAQAEALDVMLESMSIALDAVILLEISDEAVVKRLSSRRVCVSCGAIYNTASHPPKPGDLCSLCGGGVIQRDDDRETVIRNRLSVYHTQTAPLVEYYERAGLLRGIDASGAADTVLVYLEALRDKNDNV